MPQVQFPRPVAADRVAQAKIVTSVSSTLALVPPGSTVVEVGVRLGDETAGLLQSGNIAKLLAMDHFDLHTRNPEGTATRLGGKRHLDFFQERFSEHVGTKRLETRLGRLDAIKALPDGTVDAFFLRGCREFSPLMQELHMCDAKLRSRGGLIWVADYIMADYTNGEAYEVVRAVNEFVAKTSYNLICLVLDNAMFCTVVLQRPS